MTGQRPARFARGLVVGKFCPLHKGHELLIGHAQGACERITIISYTKPEFVQCGPLSRHAWLQALFPDADILVVDDGMLRSLCAERGLPCREVPHNDAPDAVQRGFVAWLCLDVLGQYVDAVFTSEAYGDGFAAALADAFAIRRGERMPVVHVCVDRERAVVPISGTALRADPHGKRDFLSPQVYAGFVGRVALLGGESSGKTTLAEALSLRLATAWVPEYGRELWVRREGRLAYDDMLSIAYEQVAREECGLAKAKQWLLCDTSPLTTLFYSLSLFGKAEPALKELAARAYDVVLLCAPDFAFVQDGTRQDAGFRSRQHAWYLAALRERGIVYQIVEGDLAQRVDMVCDRLRRP